MQNLAADAASYELDPSDVASGLSIETVDEPNPLIARDALLALAALEAEKQETNRLCSAIVERYREKTSRLDARVTEIRRGLEAYVSRFGKVSFPDVGGAHLATRRANAKVIDSAALWDWLDAQGAHEIIEAATTVTTTFDGKKALDLYLDENAAEVKPDGCIVDENGGIYELDGVEVAPETKTLTVRKS